VGTIDCSDLRNRLSSPSRLITDGTADEEFSHDATSLSTPPQAVLIAHSASDVVAAVEFCRQHQIPITPRGAGTGLSGGCVPSPGGLVISTAAMNDLDIRPDEKTAICGPGVITKDLQDQAGKYGLTYPPDPASYTESTIGGNVAEGAGGLRCKRFGVTKDYILGLEAVTGEGRLLRTGVFSSVPCFSLGDVLIASEGTLAIVTNVAVCLIGSPSRGSTILVAFETPRDAAQAVADINASGMILTVMEYMDGDTIALANEYEQAEGIEKVAAALLLETDDRDPQRQTEAVEAICQRHHCSYLRSEPDQERAEQLWQLRRNVSNAAKALAVVKVSEDVAVPNGQFPDLVAFVAQMNRKSAVRINSYGHAGDGNLHVNFLGATDSPAVRGEIADGVTRLMRETIRLGGTLTGEHGIGIAKREYLPLEFDSPTLAFMRSVKDVLDPSRVLNPEKLFPM